MTKAATSITLKTAQSVADGEEGKFLFCDRIPGLHIKSLKRKGSAAWRYRYVDAHGKRRVYTIGKFPGFEPRHAAAKALEFKHEDSDPFADRAAKREHKRREQQQSAARTVETYLEGPYKRHQDRKKTGDDTRDRIRKSFPELLDRDMATLSRADIEAWQSEREAKGRAFSTLQRDFGALKTMLRHAERQDPPLLDENPLSKVTLERPAADERARELAEQRASARRQLTEDEITRLYRALDAFAENRRAQRRSSREHGKPGLLDFDTVAYPHWFIPFAYCALYTGLRPGDLYSLTWQELNVQFGRLVKTLEKTAHHPDPAKVTMTLAGPLREVMRKWWEQSGRPTSGLVFPSPVNGGQMDSKAHGKPWRAVKWLGGLPEDLAFYSLRHHFISALVAGGVPLFTVARLAGHKGVSMIESHYGHLCPDAAAEAMDVFERSMPVAEANHG